ncbi:hypothetical protein F4777DRAFT_542845 [Nemania sp. FL0916]|nr:hypothetical protein F4777DRAFT_542845 [Nemania sp. FL0916]
MNSSYDDDYFEYKRQGKEEAKIGSLYTKWSRNTSAESLTEDPYTRPDHYGGSPMASGEWHREAARRADEAARAAQEHADQRRSYHEKYIGYHEPRYLSGHAEAIDMIESRAARFRSEVDRHTNWEPLSVKLKAGQHRADERRRLRG